jgi:hypothetical protein
MTINSCFALSLRLAMGILSLLSISGRAAGDEPAAWWQRGADAWYYKDDWKGLAISGGGGQGGGYLRTIELDANAAGGWILVWGERGYRVLVGDRFAVASIDGCLIDDYDLAGLVPAGKTVTLRLEGEKVCAEGEIIDRGGKRYAFATGEDWRLARGGGGATKVRTEKVPAGASEGAFDRAHNARLTTYNPEQRARAAVAKCYARIQRLREQGLYEMRRLRPAEEVLRFDDGDPWRRAEALAGPLVRRAEGVLAAKAVPAEKAGRHDEALAAAGEAAEAVLAAEAPVHAAAALYQAARQGQHLRNVMALVRWVRSGQSTGGTQPALPANVTTLSDEEVLDLIAGLDRPRRPGEEPRPDEARMRRQFALGDWPGVCRLAQRQRELLAEAGRAIAAEHKLVGGAGEPDEFPEDRFGWLNARKLMGNDPADWPFTMLPSSAAYLDLAGLWDFRTDPNGVGEKEGWGAGGAGGAGTFPADSAPPSGDPHQRAFGWRTLHVPMEWERQGVTEDNRKAPGAPIGKGVTGRDKPYNGWAWYRKGVLVPAGWKAQAAQFIVGGIGGVGRVFVDGKLIGTLHRSGEGRRQLPPMVLTIPADALAAGRVNTIAVQVYNHDNFGGILAGPVALCQEGARPDFRQTPGPMSYMYEYTFVEYQYMRHLTLLASAMSPAVLVASDRRDLELWGWQSKGYPAPTELLLPGGADVGKTVALAADRPVTIPAGAIGGTWLGLRGGGTNAVIVMEWWPQSIEWRPTAQGSAGLVIHFDAAPARAAVVNLPPDAKLDAAACRWWANALPAYPVSCSQVVLARPDGRRECRLTYDYCSLRPDRVGKVLVPTRRELLMGGSRLAGESEVLLAPVPMLASFAAECKFPGLELPASKETGYRCQYAAYRAVENATTLTYIAPAVDRAKVMKGVGELFARSKVEHNVHGGLGEREMFARQARWGFDHNRYALAFDADWDLPLVRGGKVSDDELLWKRLDELVKNCNDAGMQMMLCWFPEIESRRWRDRPEEPRSIYEFWRRVARRYKDLPEGAFSYDFFNEPAYMNTDHWNQVMKDLTAVVRSEDKRHMLVWESADGWAQPFWCLWMDPPKDDNVLYSFHHYGKHWGYAYDEYYPGYQCTTERAQIDPWLEAILFGLKHHVPIHCGEFGISMIQPAGCGERWLDDYLGMFERFGIGWNWWNYSGGDIYRTGLAAGDRISPYVPILMKWAARPPGRTGAASKLAR